MRAWAVVAFALFVGSSACSLLLDTEGVAEESAGAGGSAGGGPGSGGGTGGAGAGSGGSTGPGGANAPEECPWKGGPVPVKVAVVADPGPPTIRAICIDATEVTNAQYAAFLAALAGGTEPDLPPGICSFKTSFEPNEVKNGCDAMPYDPEGRRDHPVACVDWCDAYAFCRWSGKRLCGGVADGKAFPVFGNPPDNEWGAVCTGNGAYAFPWGNNTYDPPRCNTPCMHEDESGLLDAAVGVDETCIAETAEGNVYDLGGNVSEWVDACQYPDDPMSGCTTLGDSYANVLGSICGGCDYRIQGRVYAAPDVGIRCCSDAD